MKKILLLSLACIELAVMMPVQASALNRPNTNQEFQQGTEPLLAQRRSNNQYRSNQYRQSRYRHNYVYYRRPRSQQWILKGPHASRRDAQRAAYKLQRSGFRIYIRN